MIRIVPLGAFLLSAACSEGQEGTVAQGVSSGDSTLLNSPAKETVLRARAYDRADKLDSARILYEAAAKQEPLIKDWLLLRAAGVTRDESIRGDYLKSIDLPVAQDRRKPTEAIALERSGNIEAAIAAYTALGDRLAAARLRMLVPADTAQMLAARGSLAAILASPGTAQNARDAIQLFDKVYKTPTDAERLAIARAALTGGLAARSAAEYAKAFAANLGTAQDYFNAGTMLARLNRDQEAVLAYERITSPSPLAAAARYQRARALLALGRRDAARSALRDITVKFPADTSSASALLLLADLATDDNRDSDARAAYASLPKRFPRTRHAPIALFKAGLIAYVQRDYKTAAAELDSVASLYPNADDALAAMYWSGRAWAARGDTANANKRWRALLAKEGGSYYSVQASKRLGAPLLTDKTLENDYPKVSEVDRATKRISILKDF